MAAKSTAKAKPRTKAAFKIGTKKVTTVVNSEEDSDDLCSCCQDGTVYENNNIIYCDGCDVPVHQACYGVSTVPDGSWFCNPCAQNAESVTCELCKQTGGALRATDVTEKWVHVFCSSWIGEIKGLDSPG
jgi:hypothetical protein